MKLLLSQKNELFKFIENRESLTPGQFTINEPQPSSSEDTSIRLKDSDYYFAIFEDSEYVKSYFVNYVPGLDSYLEISSRIGWNEITEHFRKWLDNLTRELKEPNYWERLGREISAINFSNKFDNSKFSAREYEELKSKVEYLSQNLNSIPLLVQQQNEIKEELRRLTELAKDLGKFDWMNLFIGTIISVVIQLSITKENVEILWNLIKSTFNNYFLK
ncbi:hypothetical protein [Maribellus maritimus]|uniref:hypothetical protein n=1 Tax=Maribellus maritimus TaxID=2870838 RepID=UPI001EEAF0E2|nr:hypothetical protein [Maribellus maritimus]MCG6191504.1 hypothetical protein [Maribellus maritimus]